MQGKLNVWLLVMLLLLPSAAGQAGSMYPDTLGNGNYVCVDGGMGVGTYVDRSSVVVQQYNPPNYQIAINVVRIAFSDEYWRMHETYIYRELLDTYGYFPLLDISLLICYTDKQFNRYRRVHPMLVPIGLCRNSDGCTLF